MGLCKCTMRTVVGVIGVVFWITALFLWVLAGGVMATYGHFEQFMEAKLTLAPALALVCLGVVFFFGGILACCAMCNANRCVACLLAFFLLCVIVVLSAAGVLAFTRGPQIEETLHNSTITGLKFYTKNQSDPWTIQINYIQNNLKCCGADNYTDWQRTQFGHVPKSCCKVAIDKCNTTVPEDIYTDGCYHKLEQVIMNNLRFIEAAVLAIFVLLVLGFIAAAALVCIRRDEHMPYYSLTTG